MRHVRTLAVGFVVGAALLASPAVAQAQNWNLLGRKVVNFASDKDVIPVTAKDGRFKKIRLHVEQNAIHVGDLKVHFGNGETFDVSIRHVIKKGEYTRVIDLPGEQRVINRITIHYRTVGKRRKGRARVSVFGAHGGATPAPQPPVTPPAPPAPPAPHSPPAAPKVWKWEKLGQRQVGWKVDRDVIPVTIAEGAFKKIKIAIRGRKVHVLDLKVHFANGGTFDVKLRKDFAPGSESRVIDLPGAARVIKKVSVIYRKVGKRPGKATIVLFGKGA